MYNVDTISKIHNSYHYKLIKNDEIIDEGTVYNTANSNIYIIDIGTSITNTTTFRVAYHPFNSDTTYFHSTSIRFNRVTPKDQINYGSSIKFEGVVQFPTGGSFEGQIIGFSLGSMVEKKDSDGKVTDREYWSEASASASKTEDTTLIVNATLYIVVSQPSGGLKFYDKEKSSILNLDYNAFPTPAPSGISLSAFDLSNLSEITYLHKSIPIMCNLPTELHTSYQEGTYKLINPTTVSITGPLAGSMFLPGSGTTAKYDTNNYNFGVVNSIVFGGIGATEIGNATQDKEQENPITIPVVRLGLQDIELLLEDEDKVNYYFYASVPYGCSFSHVVTNGVQDSNIPYVDPSSKSNISITAIGMSPDEEVSITEYQNTENGSYYANYIFGTYWEPPSGTAVCPTYLYLGEKPNNIFRGNNISCTIQGYDGSSWKDIVSGIKYKTVYVDDEVNYSRYRAVVSAPGTNDTGYQVNSIETSVLPRKAYDPNVLRIGNSSNDFGTCGVQITRQILEDWKASILSDQTKVTNYTVSIAIRTTGKFYKASNTIAYLKYEVNASGSY